jgi:hypothetical protein
MSFYMLKIVGKKFQEKNGRSRKKDMNYEWRIKKLNLVFSALRYFWFSFTLSLSRVSPFYVSGDFLSLILGVEYCLREFTASVYVSYSTKK